MSNAMINEMINFCKFLGLVALIILLIVIILTIIETYIKSIIKNRKIKKTSDELAELIVKSLKESNVKADNQHKKRRNPQKKDSQ